MHVLVVLDHPDQKSLSHAIAQRFMEGAEAAGHTAELADLYVEGFDPRWTIADHIADDKNPLPDDVLSEQQRIERCDAVCFVFPLFWFGMPAMMKGWLDRVFSWGWAYDQLEDHNKSLQRDRVGVLLVPAGANPNEWEPYPKIEKAMKDIWCTGTLGYFGFTDKRVEILNGSTGSLERRKGLLERAYNAGLSIGEKQTS